MDKREVKDGWELVKLGDKNICLEIQPGFACGKKSVEGGTPHLRMNNISTTGEIDFSLIRRIPSEIAEKKSRWLKPKDVLFCNTNSTELVGKTCIFNGWKESCTYSNHLTLLRANDKKVLPEWLCYTLRHLWLNGFFATHCIEFIGQSAFNKNKVKELAIPVPPLPEQRRIVARIERTQVKAEQLRRLQAETAAELEKFMPALLAKAFRGEL